MRRWIGVGGSGERPGRRGKRRIRRRGRYTRRRLPQAPAPTRIRRAPTAATLPRTLLPCQPRPSPRYRRL
eukprot:1990426-Rhodomonas_salina.1